MRVFILLFNAGTEDEGIHTIMIPHPTAGERNLVLMFESEDDATRYALLLEAQDFPTPTAEPINSEEVQEFCRSMDYDWKLIPDGFVPETELDRLFLAPPEQNTESEDWEVAPAMPEADLDRIRRQLEGLL